MLVYTSWVWSGLRPSFHWPVVVAGLAAIGGLLGGMQASLPRVRRLDPVFILGVLFLGFLGLQWANAGRVQYFDIGYQQWMYTTPGWPKWPSAFSRSEALQMLTWFFPAWSLAVAIRSRILNRRDLQRLLILVVCNAGLLAVFGLVQFSSGTRSIYWLHPLKGHFFASFAYGNHVAPFFVLASALTAGLLFREVFDPWRIRPQDGSDAGVQHPGRIAFLVSVLLLCLTGANLGVSRAGVILAWMLFVFVAGYGLVRGWRILRPAARVNLVAGALALAASLFFLVAGFGDQAIRQEFTPKPMASDAIHSLRGRLAMEMEGRFQLFSAAIEIWRDNPWFGVGGWGFKYRVAEHVPQSLWASLEKKGWANVHCDFLQFLAEFGVIGFGLLLGAMGVMAFEVVRGASRRDSLWVMGVVGLFLVGIFSAIDLPFRCPAILYTWVVVLAALPKMCGAPAAAVWTSLTDADRGAFSERT
jgi:O-antigen ligase